MTGNLKPSDLSPHYQALVALERVQGKGVKGASKKAKRGDGTSDLEASMLGQIRMAGLPKPTTEFVFAPSRKWRFDGAWLDRFVAYEVDGASWSSGRHVRGAGFAEDCLKLSTAAALGWRVLRFTGAMVEDGTALRLIEQALTDERDRGIK